MRPFRLLRTLSASLALVVLLASPVVVEAQMDTRPPATNLQWWHPVAAGAGTGLLFLIDRPLQDAIQDGRGDFGDDLARFTQKFKEPEVFVVATAGTLALGLATGDRKITATGVHIATPRWRSPPR